MARVTFESIFEHHREDNTLEPRQVIRVNGVTLGPGVRFQNSVIGGVNFQSPEIFKHDLEVKTEGEITVITGAYSSSTT